MSDAEEHIEIEEQLDHEGTEDDNPPEVSQEWDMFPGGVPSDWHPLPIFKVKNIPVNDAVTTETIKSKLEDAGLQIHSVHFETGPGTVHTAYVRLVSPQMQERADEDTPVPGPDEDVVSLATSAVSALKALPQPLMVEGYKLIFDSSYAQVMLFVGNLTEEWEDDVTLKEQMSQYGTLVRCFVVRNWEGHSKGYAYVQYATPAEAQKAKAGLDAFGQKMKPDGQSKNQLSIKLLRAEWTRPTSIEQLFGRVLYISHLRDLTDDLLNTTFGAYGPVKEIHIPKNKGTGANKGFAFVEYEQSAITDKAYQDLNSKEHDLLGNIMVSFANPAKCFENPGNAKQDKAKATNKADDAEKKPVVAKQDANQGVGAAGKANAGVSGVGRGGRFGAGRGFPGRGTPVPGRVPMAGHGPIGPMTPMGVPGAMMGQGMPDPMMAMQMHQQQQMQLRIMQQQMQQQLAQQQALMQAELQRQQQVAQQEMQRELAKARAQLAQQQGKTQEALKQAEAKLKAETDARRRAEQDLKAATAAAAAQMAQFQAQVNSMGGEYMRKQQKPSGGQQGGYGMSSQKGMADFASPTFNGATPANPYGAAGFGQSPDIAGFSAGGYSNANMGANIASNLGSGLGGNLGTAFGNGLGANAETPMGMQGFNQSMGSRMGQQGGFGNTETSYGGGSIGQGGMAGGGMAPAGMGGGAGGMGGGADRVYGGQAAGYAMGQSMYGANSGFSGQGAQGYETMYSGGMAGQGGGGGMAGAKRETPEMNAYAQGYGGGDAANGGFGMPGMRSNDFNKRPRY